MGKTERLKNAEQERLDKKLRDTRVQIEIEETRLKNLKNKKDVRQAVNPTREQESRSNALRESRLNLELVRSELNNVSGRKKHLEESIEDLENSNYNLSKINDRAIKEKIKMTDEVKTIKSKLQKKYDENEAKISKRLDEIDTIKTNFEKSLIETEANQIRLTTEMIALISKKNKMASEAEKVIALQAELNLKITRFEKKTEGAEKVIEEYNRHKANLQKEEDGVNAIRLKVMKVLNDNKQITELDKLRKEINE